MSIVYWVLMIFLILVFMVAISNCVDTKKAERHTDIAVSVTIFLMIVSLIIIKYVFGG